jgi:hypothetical protein
MRRSLSLFALVVMGLVVTAGCGTPGGGHGGSTTSEAPPPAPRLFTTPGPTGFSAVGPGQKILVTGTGFVPGHTYMIRQCATHCVDRPLATPNTVPPGPFTAQSDGTIPAPTTSPAVNVLLQYTFVNSPVETCDTSANCRLVAVPISNPSDPSATLAISFVGH